VKRKSCSGYELGPIGSSLREVERQVGTFDDLVEFYAEPRPPDLMGQKEGDYEGRESARASAKRGMTTPDEQGDRE
jgi:hypothetical protein